MKLQSPPSIRQYLTQIDNELFNELFAQKRAELSLDWIERNNNEVVACNAELQSTGSSEPLLDLWSDDYGSDDFPTYRHWPEEWQAAFQAAKNEADAALKKELETAEKHTLGDMTIYLRETDEKVWLSTQYYDNGSIGQ